VTLHAVFAYGSNMCLPDLARWLAERGHPQAAPAKTSPGLLLDHRLVWNYRSPVRKGGAANVQRADGEHLPGVVLHVEHALLVALDEKEGHPERYLRTERLVETDGEQLHAWVYEVTEEWRNDADIWPRRAYLDVMLRGAADHDLPREHLDMLRALPTMD
jgi:gamma-glutamylcyclotransferase (GGCT)/AIG2-like uncharacterized protein YtfP